MSGWTQERLANEIARARFDNFAPRPLGPSGRVRLELATTDNRIVHHSLIYRDGLCVDWVIDRRPGPWALRIPVPTRHHFVSTPALEDLADTKRFALRVGTRTVAIPPFDEFAADIWRLPDLPARVDGLAVDTDLDVVMIMSGTPIGDFAFTFPFRDGAAIDPRADPDLLATDNVIEMRFDWATRALGPRRLQSHLDWLDRGFHRRPLDGAAALRGLHARRSGQHQPHNPGATARTIALVVPARGVSVRDGLAAWGARCGRAHRGRYDHLPPRGTMPSRV